MPNANNDLSELPDTIPVFPLPGAPLFPRWTLPLNIFEPRYLNMIDDAMTTNRLIGMVQSLDGPKDFPNLADVGCLGKISSFEETSDGRYSIILTGIARYRIVQELDVHTPYRQVKADFTDYASDLDLPDLDALPPRLRLETALQIYTDAQGFEADWEAVEDAPAETLIHALATGCPFDVDQKQALLEAEDLKSRCEALITLLSVSAQDDQDKPNGPFQ